MSVFLMGVERRDRQYCSLVRLFSVDRGPAVLQHKYEEFDAQIFTAHLIKAISEPWGFDPQKHVLEAVLPSLQDSGIRNVDLVEEADVLVLKEPPRSIFLRPKENTDLQTWYARYV